MKATKKESLKKRENNAMRKQLKYRVVTNKKTGNTWVIILEDGMSQKSPRIPTHGRKRGIVGGEGAESRDKRSKRGNRQIG